VKSIIATLAVGLALVVGGCSSDSEPGAPAPREFYSDPEPQPTFDREQAAIDLAYQQAPSLAAVPESDLRSLAESNCDMLDVSSSQYTVDEIFGIAMKAGVSPRAAGTIIAMSVLGFCPEHKPALNDWINSSGTGV